LTLYCGSAGGGIFRADLGEACRGPALRASDGPLSCFFLAGHPRRPVLYAADAANGAVEAYERGGGGALRRIGRREFPGAAPCHLAVDPAGRFLLVAEYRGGVRLLPLADDGRLEGEGCRVRFGEAGPEAAGRRASRPHGVTLGPGGRRAYVADLGADRIFTLKVGLEPAALEPIPAETVAAAPGSGPRHLALSPDGNRAIVVNELGNTLASLGVDRAGGGLRPGGLAGLLPPGHSGKSWAAEAGFHPSGAACYASNRGHDSLVFFAVEAGSGELGPPRWLGAGGSWPVHFAFAPDGTGLFVANEKSDCVAAHALDPRTGEPRGEPSLLALPRPTCALLRPD
jgi:6-phosphogluconolactonase